LADVYVVSAAGGTPKRLTTDEREIFGLRWTADGREIVFSSTRSGEPALWRVPVSGGAPRRVLEAGEHAWFPSISRQGRRLVFTRQLSDLNIWRVEAPGIGSISKRSARLTASTKTEMAPEFSPDGKRIVWSGCLPNAGTCGLTLTPTDGSGAAQVLTRDNGGNAHWSPDGKRIVYQASDGAGHLQVFVINADGTGRKQLTEGKNNDVQPAWSRDGGSIFWRSDQNGTAWAIYVMYADGSNKRLLIPDTPVDPNLWAWQTISVAP